MSRTFRSLLLIAVGSFFAANSFAQTSSPPKPPAKKAAATQKAKSKPTTQELSAQVDALQGRFDHAQTQIQQQQTQIEQLQKSLQDSVNALQQQQRQLQDSVQRAHEQAIVARDTASSADTKVTSVESSVSSFSNSLQAQDTRVKSLESPTTIHYKGITLSPGGFLEATELWRQRNENADIASSFTGIPLNGTSNSKLGEYRGSARDTRLSLLGQANAGSTKLTGYVEVDFLGAAPTANFVQSSSFTPRIRQAFMQMDTDSGWTVTAGQFWSLLTTDRKGVAPRSEWIPNVMDGSYVVGFTWTRERNVRVAKNFHNGIWAAFEVDDPENTYSAAFVPPNVMGLNTSQNTSTGVLLLPFLANYSNGTSTTLVPDLLAKVVFEPGWGHFEIKMLGRFFRDSIASTATTTGFKNYSEGWGVGFGAILPVVKDKVDIIAEGLAGQGIGRYGASGLPDVTLDPKSGEMRPLRQGHLVSGIEYHANRRLQFFGYFGDEYAERYAYVSPTGGPAGYGSPLVSYTGCTNEVAINTCSGANRNIYDGTVGYWFRLYQGEFGRVQYGNQVEYLHRSLWSGVGRTPQGGELLVFSTVRLYLP
jgi:hypothetical protein